MAELALRSPRRVAGVVLALFVAAAAFGLPVTTKLLAGGYDVPGTEFTQAEQILADKFDTGGFTLIMTVTDPAGVDSDAAKARGADVVAGLHRSPYARQIISYWATPPRFAGALVGRDHTTALVVAQVSGNDRDAPQRAHDMSAELAGDRDGVTVHAGGEAISQYELNRQSRVDLVTLELVAAPFTFLALVWIFGSVIAAILPLAVAGFAIAATTAALRTLFAFTDVAVFALNLATALCLALAVDYTLFIINRYREEVAAGEPRDRALIRTMNTAGRTVIYSALTVVVTAATMFAFPIYFLRSLAYAGLAGVGFSLLGSLLVAPTLIVLLGDKLDAGDIRKPIRRLLRRPEPVPKAPEQTFWYRTATFAMRRAVPVIVVLGALFLLLGSPLLGTRMGYPDDRVLPTSSSARQVGEILRGQFSEGELGVVHIVMPSGASSSPALSRYAIQLSKIPGVNTVSAPGGVYAHGELISIVTVDSAQKGDAAYLAVTTDADPLSPAGQDQLATLKEVPTPAPALFTGLAQRERDDVHGIVERLPWMLALIAISTLVLIFLMTGSVVLPIKALIMNMLSLTAAFGVMTWIFQDGHLGGLGTVATGSYNYTMPPLLVCLAYGLSMDYEVFVLSRMREEWLRSGGTAADNQRAVALGLARTGRIVTAAATVMAIVFLSITTAQVSFMRALGVGLALTVVLDAFLVRPLLVPAFMRLLGRANWWAPGPLARWHARRGFTETEHETVAEVEPAPRTDISV
ncbi:MMPL family transporter [Nocardia aurantia]|nr:MMPL family transporter [Nocardia aurantia]